MCFCRLYPTQPVASCSFCWISELQITPVWGYPPINSRGQGNMRKWPIYRWIFYDILMFSYDIWWSSTVFLWFPWWKKIANVETPAFTSPQRLPTLINFAALGTKFRTWTRSDKIRGTLGGFNMDWSGLRGKLWISTMKPWFLFFQGKNYEHLQWNHGFQRNKSTRNIKKPIVFGGNLQESRNHAFIFHLGWGFL